MAPLELRGTEMLTLEVELTCDPAVASGLLPPGIDPDIADDGAHVSLLLFAMEGMRAVGWPSPRLKYHEALWRVRARRYGDPVFFAVACDLDHPLVRTIGATAIQYPVRSASFEVNEFDPPIFKVEADDALLHLSARRTDVECPVVEPLPLISEDGGDLYLIPWRETPGPHRREATLTVHDDALAKKTIGEVRWPQTAVLMRGRTHHCGFATKLEP